MTPFKVTCEHCDASFRISDESKIGKRVKCPKCGEAFTVQSPDDDEEFSDDFDEPAPKPVRRSAGGKKPARSGSRRSSPGKKSSDSPAIALYAGGGLLAVVVALGGLWAGGFFGGSSVPAPANSAAAAPSQPPATSLAAILDRLPATTEVIVSVRLKDALNSPLLAAARTPQLEQQLKSPNPLIPGTTVGNIESLVMSVSDLTLQFSEQKRLAATGQAPTMLPPRPIMVVQLTDPLTPEFMNLPPESAIAVEGATIYRLPQSSQTGTPPCLVIAEPKTVVLGTEEQLKAFLSQSASSGLSADFAVTDSSAHFALAICPRSIVQQVERLAVNNIELPQLHAELNRFVKDGGRTMGLNLSFGADLGIALSVLPTDPAKLPQLQAALEKQLESGRAMTSSPAAAANPFLAQLKPAMDGLKATTEGSMVSARTTVSKETLASLGPIVSAFGGGFLNGLQGGGVPNAPAAASPGAP